MTAKEAKDRVPEPVRDMLKKVPKKYWIEFAMLWWFHEEFIGLKQRMREDFTGHGNTRDFIVQVLRHSAFIYSDERVELIQCYIEKMSGMEVMEPTVERIHGCISDFHDGRADI